MWNNQNNQYPLGGYNQNQYQQQGMPVGNQQYNQNGYTNININGNMGIEKKGDLGKLALILTIMGLFCCGITTIPGIICAIVAFIKDRHNAMNIAAMILAILQIGIGGLIFLGSASDSLTKDMNIEDVVNSANITSANQRIIFETREDNGTQIYNSNGIEIYYNGIDSDSLDFKFFAKNNYGKDIKIKCEDFFVNGYDFNGYMNMSVSNAGKANDSINMSIYAMNENDIDLYDLNEVSGTLLIIDADTDDEIDTFEFSIK